MAAQNSFPNLPLGVLLQIAYTKMVYNQLSEDYSDWEAVFKKRVSSAQGRQHNYAVTTSLGPAAVQAAPIGAITNFPSDQSSTVKELTATFKETDVTIRVPLSLWQQAQRSPQKYADVLTNEIANKAIASRRFMAAQWQGGDGTGVIGTVSASAIESGKSLVDISTLSTSRGNIGMFEEGDLIYPYTAAGAPQAPTVSSGTFSHYRVDVKDRENDQVTLTAILTTGAEGVVTVTNLVATDVFYRKSSVDNGETLNLTSIGASDYSTLTSSAMGLESIAAYDGRQVNGIAMSGVMAATRKNCSGQVLDASHIGAGMSQVLVRVGENRFKYTKLVMSPEAYDSMIESKETDRRFVAVTDNARGSATFKYIHKKHALEACTSEFIKKTRILALPEASQKSQNPLQYLGTDFEIADVDGSRHLDPAASGAGHQRSVSQYMIQTGVALNTCPAATLVIDNFTL